MLQDKDFFVEAKTTNTAIFFAESNQHHNADSFQKSTPKTEIKLNFCNDTRSINASIYYINGTKTGYNDGYDGKMFGGFSHHFAIYTYLVSKSDGTNY